MSKFSPGSAKKEDKYKSERDSTTSGTPRWVKMFGIIAIVLVLLAIIIMLFSGGNHGPARHFKSDEAGSQTSHIEYEVQQL